MNALDHPALGSGDHTEHHGEPLPWIARLAIAYSLAVVVCLGWIAS